MGIIDEKSIFIGLENKGDRVILDNFKTEGRRMDFSLSIGTLGEGKEIFVSDPKGDYSLLIKKEV